MKKILLNLSILMFCGGLTNCQTAVKDNKANTTSSDPVMLHPDRNTEYFNEIGQKIDTTNFWAAIKTGNYSFDPKVVEGKLKSLQLKKTGEDGKSGKTISSGEAAPDFSLTDIKGNSISLKKLKGKIVLLNFWFTACAPCVKEIPELNALVEKYKNNKDIVFLAVTFDSAAKVSKFLSGKPFNFDIAADQATMIQSYNITNFPSSLIIDKSGNVAFSLSSYDGTNVEQLDGVLTALKNY